MMSWNYLQARLWLKHWTFVQNYVVKMTVGYVDKNTDCEATRLEAGMLEI